MLTKVFYLDDELPLLEVFSDTFSSDQIEIKTFSDPEELISAVSLNRPDLVFLDYRLPNVTGNEIAEKLDASIPKVLITGDLTVTSNKDFVAFIEKPMNVKLVQNLINAHLRKVTST